MTLPDWLPFALWIGTFVAIGAAMTVTQARFFRAHQRRFRTFRSEQERLGAFVRGPGTFLTEEPEQLRRRMEALLTPTSDPEIESLRRTSAGLSVALILVMFGGLFPSLVAVAALRRILEGHGFLIIPQLAILAFWGVVLIRVVRSKKRSKTMLTLLVAAVLGSSALLVGTIALTKG